MYSRDAFGFTDTYANLLEDTHMIGVLLKRQWRNPVVLLVLSGPWCSMFARRGKIVLDRLLYMAWFKK